MVWLIFSICVFAADVVEQVRLFSGNDQVRIMIHLNEPIERINTQSMPGVDGNNPKVYIKLKGPKIDEQTGFAVDHTLVSRLVFAPSFDGVQLTANLNQTAVAKVHRLRDELIVVDIKKNEHTVDDSLPTLDTLERWVNQVGLVEKSQKVSEKFRIVIDPGHGGDAHGAVGTTGTREADIALELSKRLGYFFEKYDNVEVIYTREDDTFLTLSERTAIANKSNADVFISIHANAAPTSDLWGIETYSMDTASDEGAARVAARENSVAEKTDGTKDMLLGTLVTTGTNLLSKDLAESVQMGVISDLQSQYGKENIRDLGAKTALFYVLVATRMPAILFEASFVSNPEDERRLRTPHFQNAIARSMAESTYTWLESQE